MDNRLEKILHKEFPQLFADKDKSSRETLMCFGCACGDGWFSIIRNACKEIMDTNPSPKIKFAQIKEKFGGLRLYMTAYNDEISKITGKAEAEAYRTCEECGSKENVGQTSSGWIHTLCKSCEKMTREEREEQAKKAVRLNEIKFQEMIAATGGADHEDS